MKITGPSNVTYTSPLRSSHSDTLYMLSPSKFSLSSDPLHEMWLDVVGPKVWRTDPIVAIVGSCIVVAGGTCDFEDDPLTVELYDTACPGWFTCQPIPNIPKDSAASIWLSVAVSDYKMYLLEKKSGTFCSFDPSTKTWSGDIGSFDLRPDPAIYFSVIGFVGGLAENFIYIYNSSELRDIFFCDLSARVRQWSSIRCTFLNDRVLMDRFVFTCSKVNLDNLRKAFWVGSKKFKVELAETVLIQ
ncbi:hypothetical protein C5167_004870 [Papaver somniferum]|uniref:F-box associated domain-containing protein n=1 Tax=Papaver somniferum TaxID=3469 RepID=A0A4Y7JAN0_PAPSO|nr:hypothetical protein C5167_004870 [Papaver somniferum]